MDSMLKVADEKFSIEKDKDEKPIVEELEGEVILDRLLAVFNDTGAKLFKQLSIYTNEGRVDDLETVTDAAAEVHTLAVAHMTKSGEKDLSTAIKHILAENEELRIAYAQS